jgi:hypothetical protein
VRFYENYQFYEIASQGQEQREVDVHTRSESLCDKALRRSIRKWSTTPVGAQAQDEGGGCDLEQG